jgi:hypothetical protein
MTEPIVLRVSPSGIIAGDETHPPLAGGVGDPPDGSKALSRQWIFKGAGAATNVPGTTAAGDLLGMEALACDLRVGYSYDIELDMYVYGTLTALQDLTVLVNASKDDGSTFPNTLAGITTGPGAMPAAGYANIRLRTYVTAFGAPGEVYDHVQATLQRLDADAAADLVYAPALATLKITEYSG